MTLSALGIFSAAGAGGATQTFELISTEIVSGSSTSVITFSNLANFSAIYKHLQIRMTARLTASTGITNANFRINGDTGANYAWHRLGGYGSNPVESGASTSATSMALGNIGTANQATNAFSGSVIDILDPYATKNKTVRSLQGIAGGTNNVIELRSGVWLNTTSITSISLTVPSDNYAAGSRFSLYGIRG